jgi:hypothetical protein
MVKAWEPADPDRPANPHAFVCAAAVVRDRADALQGWWTPWTQ